MFDHTMNTNSLMKVVLLGASVRPLIASCFAAGCVPVAFDFFADWDGQQMIRESGCQQASLTKIDRYEDLLELDFASLGDVAILAGGAELRPDLVRTVGQQIPLLGPDAQSLATIGDPVRWLQVLQESGCRVPETRRELPDEAGWLVKQRGTCGGSGVRMLDAAFNGRDGECSADDLYFQKRIPGQSWSAILVSHRQPSDNTSQTFLLGCTRQWLAASFADVAASKPLKASPYLARPFAYHGSVGPLSVSKSVQRQVDRMAGVLGRRFAMQGVWGVDFVLDAEGQVWPVDFNPRITASAELFESSIVRSESTFRSVVDLHLSACGAQAGSDETEFEKLADDRAAAWGAEDCEAKRIVFLGGSESIKIDKSKWEQLSCFHVAGFFQSNQTGASIADVPRLGDRIEVGRPLLSIRSRAKTEAAAVALLDELFDAVQDCVVGV